MTLRSLLFVPGDSERKQVKARGTAADALILDLEDSVAPGRLGAARDLVREFLSAPRSPTDPALWVRVNGPGSGRMLEDLDAVCVAGPDGIVLPKVSDGAEIHAAAEAVTRIEQASGRAVDSTGLILIATETARGVQSTMGYTALPRVRGITWGAEDLAAALGATTNRDPDGAYAFTFRLARSLCLIAAASMGVQAIDGVYVDFRDLAGLEREARAARREGFLGGDVERAKRIVAAFDAAPGAGVLSLDGQMLDKPHLAQAKRVLAAADAAARRRLTPDA
jgi:citrate lyase subunit beta/citryl-CoA lyase